MKGDGEKIVLYDGVCNLCDAAVRFVLERDSRETLRFAALQGNFARALLARHGIPAPAEPESILLFENGRVFSRSDAALRIARHLDFPWKLAAVFLLFPRRLRDFVYAWVARNRYRWFGKNDACLLPSPKWKDRFIDADEDSSR
jgi:predicted DCC family thiol-disulfide oxidoreductase YuxK